MFLKISQIWDVCEIFKTTFFYRIPPVAASEDLTISYKGIIILKGIFKILEPRLLEVQWLNLVIFV